MVDFISAAQLAPSKIDVPEFHILISQTNLNPSPKHSTYIGGVQSPLKSARVQRRFVTKSKRYQILNIPLGGGTAIRPKRFTITHMTAPSIREGYLMRIEALRVPHTGKYFFGELEEVSQTQGIPYRTV